MHDFFTPQTQPTASVFLLKQIMHDWPDDRCVVILNQLWEAATPTTALILMESIRPLVCRDPSVKGPGAIEGAAPKEAESPLLANYGAVNEMGYNAEFDVRLPPHIEIRNSFCSSVQMFNSQERTLLRFVELLRKCGWEVVKVRRQPGDSTFLQGIEAKKVAKPTLSNVF
ncbi:hypothetical protein C8R44DRAFT_611770 [Mycena epipterygia]|nr:hypothetical protein C8R44DRAFT_611770 [Mycena epipterygia]